MQNTVGYFIRNLRGSNLRVPLPMIACREGDFCTVPKEIGKRCDP